MVAGEACVVAGGRVWLWRGVHGCWEGAWLPGGMGCSGVHGCWGAWVAGGCVGYNEIRSMSGRYASYWNAFLFTRVVSTGRGLWHRGLL